MRLQNRLTLALCAAILLLQLFSLRALGQQPDKQTQAGDDVLRINTELVQSGVVVLDKQGRFVDGLKKEDFELRVDGKPVPISFFENILAGTQREQLARSGKAATVSSTKTSAPAPSMRRRTVIFFMDDLHLSLDSVGRTRKMILDFIDNQMGQNDLVAIASASGRIGFLQQFTDNKDVLRAAVARLSQSPNTVIDNGRGGGSPMTENMALSIERKDDPQVFKFYVDECVRYAPRMPRGDPRISCEVEVKNRARIILIQSAQIISGTYYSLDTLLQSAQKLPGSKLAFFVSDGFLLDTGPRGLSLMNKLRQVTDDALRAGVVVYTIDARGLVSGTSDATNSLPMDPNGTLETAMLREIPGSQDALNAIAADTGGRALRNQNYFNAFVTDALEETSRYYLLAWRPEADEQKTEKFKKIEITVVGRSDLTVRSARGFLNNRPSTPLNVAKEEKPSNPSSEKKPDTELRQALLDFYPKQGLPLQLSLIYLDTPTSGSVLTSSVQASTEVLSYGEEGKDPAQLTVAGVILNDQGKPAGGFKTGLKVNPASTGKASSTVIYNNRATLKPGLYQVRVAARDDRSGLLGSSMQWILIPDLSTHQLSLSSLIVGLEQVTTDNVDAGQIQWSVDKKFAHGSHLRFMTFIYNAARANGSMPDLVARVQVYKDGKAVVNTSFNKVTVDNATDPARVPFTADISLGSLQAGRYLLQVTIEDRAARKSVSQQTSFDVQ